jgi:hypothetical protein
MRVQLRKILLYGSTKSWHFVFVISVSHLHFNIKYEMLTIFTYFRNTSNERQVHTYMNWINVRIHVCAVCMFIIVDIKVLYSYKV